MERHWDFDFGTLVGKTVREIRGGEGDEEMSFVFDGLIVTMRHDHDCCESVSIEDIFGDLDDLIGSPLLLSEEVVSEDAPSDVQAGRDYTPDSETWTFYKFSTIKGSVTIRWFGSSNGYYSESVTVYVEELDPGVGPEAKGSALW